MCHTYVHDTNCMTTFFIGNVGEKNLANCGDSPNSPNFLLYGNCFSIESKAKSIKRCSDIVECRKVFVCFSTEDDRWHSAVLTAIVRVIYSSLTNVGKAAFNKYNSWSTSFILYFAKFVVWLVCIPSSDNLYSNNYTVHS